VEESIAICTPLLKDRRAKGSLPENSLLALYGEWEFISTYYNSPSIAYGVTTPVVFSERLGSVFNVLGRTGSSSIAVALMIGAPRA